MFTYVIHLLSLSLGITFLMLGPALVIHAKSKKNLFGIGCALLPSFLFASLLAILYIPIRPNIASLYSIFMVLPIHFFLVGIFALASGLFTNKASKHIEDKI
jgi:hypothetical protein